MKNFEHKKSKNFRRKFAEKYFFAPGWSQKNIIFRLFPRRILKIGKFLFEEIQEFFPFSDFEKNRKNAKIFLNFFE